MQPFIRGRKKQTTAFEQLQHIYDNMFGYDILTIEKTNEKYVGIINSSPIEPILIENFKYQKLELEHQKPFKAHWIINENKLFLMYVNAIINNKRYFTQDIIPDFPESNLFFHYTTFTGIIKFTAHYHETDGFKNKYPNGIQEHCKLHFKNGILEKEEWFEK